MLDGGTALRSALEAAGTTVVQWDRRVGRVAATVSPWPPEGTFGWVGLRLPKGVDELRMLTRVAASRLAPGGLLWIYGANDEGIRSAGKRLGEDFGSLEDVAVGGRCRVIQAGDPVKRGATKLEDWIEPISDPRLPRDPWVSFPGCFAHAKVDQGTDLLLAHLPEIAPGARVLDFACGTGVVGGVVQAATRDAEIVLLDNDALSLEAAHLNLPRATTVLSQGFSGLGEHSFDWIVSNPPYHSGKAGTAHVLKDLCLGASGYLRSGGGLRLVVQSTHAILPLLEKSFPEVSVVAESSSFRVWNALKAD